MGSPLASYLKRVMLRTIFVCAIGLVAASYAIRGAFYALLFYLWIAYFRPESWMWDPSLIEALKLSFVTGLYLLVRLPGSDAEFKFDLRSILLFAFLLLSLASTVTSRHFAYAWPFWIEFAKTVVITYVLSILITDPSQYRTVLLVIALSVGFEAAKQGWVEMVKHPGAKNMNEFPSFGDNNGVAVGMLMLMSLFIALAQTATRTWERYLHQFLAVGVLYRALSTYSRGGFLACCALVGLYVLRSKQKVKSGLGALAVALLVVSVLPQSFWDRMSTIPLSKEQVEREGDDSQLSRLHFWNVAVAMANANPWLGVGHNAFNINYNRYDFSFGRFGKGRSVHSSWFGVLAELGYTGLTLYVVVFGLAMIACSSVARRARAGDLPSEFGHYAIGLQNSLAVFFVGGSFVPWQYTEMLWHIVGLSMALRTIAARHQANDAAAVASPVFNAFRVMPPVASAGADTWIGRYETK
jgi:probable O-glycosylation ligase (exosortase A-associated)